MAFNEQQLQCFARFEAAMRQNMTQQMATQVEAVQQAPELAACWSTVLFTLDTLAPQTRNPKPEPLHPEGRGTLKGARNYRFLLLEGSG